MYKLLFLSLLLVGCDVKPAKHSSFHESEPVLSVPSGEPESLDPRVVRSVNGVTALHLIYDGLLRHNYNGELVSGLAREYDVSPDLKTYTFRLREAVWSNGDPVTAEDFVETWISQLDPDFPSPNAYQLFVIKGAKAYKEGRLGKNHVGVKALKDHTLEVTLEQPVPYFPELVAADFFFAVHKSTREGRADPEKPVSNGPFVIDHWRHNNSIRALRNELYWDSAEVKLDQVELVLVDDTTALNLFLSGALHWAGSPNSSLPTDSLTSLHDQGKIFSTPSAGTALFRFNTGAGLLKNVHLRRALSLAIDREAITEHLMKEKYVPAYGLLPIKWRKEPLEKPDALAFNEFQEALKELGTDRDSLPTLTLCYASNNERNQRIAQAVQQQWQKALGIQVALEQCESVVFFDKLHQMNYDISLGSWFADFKDPINFLEVFKKKATPTNNTGWENPHFIALLDESAIEKDPLKREEILEQAEAVLLAEAPIAPLFHVNFLYAKKSNVHGVAVSELGHFDFKYAFIDDESAYHDLD